ncbi:hypothetical protein [Vibrio agarivorans]|uniref:Lipoprotein n=1 Tax=Vibrio agarivorans TaxID=153622 RepID=A0ABT7XXA1_9VIBR|nr:hypothetical protein [Vibrio agarivorans]MDN2480400.1 hypothetical protein [Vibrio agarivorans]
MKDFVIISLFIVLTGCAERYLNGKGSEYLVYPETHTYAFSVRSEPETRDQIDHIITTVMEIDPGASYTIKYRNSKAKRVVDAVMANKRALPLSAEHFSISRNSNLSKDLEISITYHTLKQEKCNLVSVDGPDVGRDCFVEAARVQQVIHKERLVEGL